MNKNVSSRLRRQIILYTLLSILLSNCLIAFIAITPLKRELRTRQTEWLESQLDGMAAAANQCLGNFMDLTRQITSRTMIRQQLDLYNQGRLSREELRAYTAPKIGEALSKVPEIVGMVRLDAKLEPVVYVGERLPEAFLPHAFPEGGTVWVSTPQVLDGRPVINMGANILDGNGRLVGLDLVSFNLDNMVALVRDRARLGETGSGELCYLDASGEAPRLQSLEPGPAPGLCEDLTDSGLIADQYENRPLQLQDGADPSMIFMQQRLPFEGFRVVVAMDSAELYNPANRLLLLVIGLILLASLVSLVGIYYMLRPLARRFLLREEELRAMIGEKVDDLKQELAAREALTRELENAREQAEAANRAKSAFLANMSHEVRTPMNGILGMAELSLMSNPPAQIRRYLELLAGSGRHLLDIVNDILDLSKIEAGKVELAQAPFDLKAELECVAEPLGGTARERGLALSLSLPGDVPRHLVGDAGRLRQVLVNLIGNAVKFTPQGLIEVRVATEDSSPGRVRLRFEIQDTGMGIPENELEKIFEGFAQGWASANPKYGGTGLGLTISRELVELMGGKIWLRSELGRGSTFFFTAEFAIDDQAGAPLPAGQRQAPDGFKPLRVLLAEDNQINQIVMMDMLVNAGHRATLASNGREVIERLAEGNFDLVLMDIQMPVMTGDEAARRIRSGEVPGLDSDIPIIALTAYAMDGDSERFLSQGMNGYLAKPVKYEQLCVALKGYCGG